MKKLLLFLLCAALMSAQSISIITTNETQPGFADPNGLSFKSHGSVAVDFSNSVPGVNAVRAHASAPNGSCTSGTVNTGDIVIPQGGSGMAGNWKRFPWQSSDINTGYQFTRAVFVGLLPNTTYQLCPEVSTNGGSTWSSGVGVTYHTLAQPSIHPVPPAAPVSFDTSYPAENLALGVPAATPCSGLVAAIKAAQANQVTTPAVISISPTDSTCRNININYANSADLVTWASSSVNLSNNTLAVQSYPSGVTHITEGQGLRFDNVDGYHNKFPEHLRFLNHGAGVPIPYVFYAHFPTQGDNTNFQLFYPQPYSQCPSCLYTLGADAGGRTADNGNYGSVLDLNNSLKLYQWPRQLKTIVVRTSTPDSQFVPEKVRLTPDWDSKLAHIGGFSITSAVNGDGNQLGAEGKIRYVGIKFYTPAPTYSASPNPIPIGGSIGTEITTSDITFDRCWIHGPDFPDRQNKFMNFDGANMAIIDSIMDSFNFWTPGSTWEGYLPNSGGGTGLPFSGRTLTIPPGWFSGGAFQYKQSGTITLTLAGSPSNPSASNMGLIYADVNGGLHAAIPAGVSGFAANVTTEVALSTNGNNNCFMQSPIVPKVNSNGRASVAPIGCFVLNNDGTIGNSYPAYVAGLNGYQEVGTGDSGEGSNTVIAGMGSGPMKVENTFFEGNGIMYHMDDCLSGSGNTGQPSKSCLLDIGDYTFRRNRFLRPLSQSSVQPSFDGMTYKTRQMLEWKHGQRILATGNIFEGPQGCSDQENTGTTFLTKTQGYPVFDVKVNKNIFRDGCGVSSWGTYYGVANGPGIPAMARWEFTGNLIFNLNGWANSDYIGAAYQGGVAWLFQENGASEDVNVSHNTFMDFDGLVPHIVDFNSFGNEGLTINNNLIFYPTTPGGGGSGIRNGGTGPWDNNAQPYCGTKVDKDMLACAAVNYSFAGNVLVPGWNSSNIYGVSCPTNDASFQNRNCRNRGSLPLTGQTSYAALSAAFSGLPSTIVNTQSGVPAAIESLKFIDSAKRNYRFRNDSPLISGGALRATDGKDVGADIDALEQETGKVTLIGVAGSSLSTTGATITFVAPDSQACPIDLSTDPAIVSSFTRFSDSGTSRVRNVGLSGLQTGTTYFYRVECAVEQPAGTFRTRQP